MIKRRANGMTSRLKSIMTPKGAKLGESTMIDGQPGLHYKAGKKEDDLTPEQVVECITNRKVMKIVYMQSESEPALQCM